MAKILADNNDKICPLVCRPDTLGGPASARRPKPPAYCLGRPEPAWSQIKSCSAGKTTSRGQIKSPDKLDKLGAPCASSRSKSIINYLSPFVWLAWWRLAAPLAEH